jgi:outer membrane receptor protein involved in Fe transport
LNVRNVPLTGDPNELFAPENLWPMNGNLSNGTTFEATFLPVNPNQYTADIVNIAGYVSAELNPIKKMKTIIGLRVENYTQFYTGQDQLGYKILSDEQVLNDLGFFPTFNLNYTINEKHNLRLSYTQTIARPSFKELSYAEIYDPITGRTFIGGLFKDENTSDGTVYWDGNLKSTDIYNYDFRWEFFPSPGQTISAGAFYKKLINPIEMVQFVSQTGSFQPRNVGDGQITGAEVEVRQSMNIIAETLSNFSIAFNFTLIESQIKLSNTEYESRVDNARTGQNVDEYREMAGQAPYLINGGINYQGNEQGFWNGLEAGLYYNVQGKTLQYVGIADRPDIYTNPFHSLNFNANKRFGRDRKMQLGIKVDNLLNSKMESVFSSYNTSDKFFTRLEPGTKYQLRFSYNIF